MGHQDAGLIFWAKSHVVAGRFIISLPSHQRRNSCLQNQRLNRYKPTCAAHPANVSPTYRAVRAWWCVRVREVRVEVRVDARDGVEAEPRRAL